MMSSKNKIYIPESDPSIAGMFNKRGFTLVDKPSESSAIVFSGGPDITPMYYGELPHPQTKFSIDRDIRDTACYRRSMRIGDSRPLVGICRGGQFLNVMCGGGMWQHVDGHAIHKTHKMRIKGNKETIDVTSTHHQMMKPSRFGDVLAYASITTKRESGDPNVIVKIEPTKRLADDPEVIYYAAWPALCFQPHPEYEDRGPYEDMQEYFFQLLDTLLDVH